MLSEHVYCVAVVFKITERVAQWICITFCGKLEYSSAETSWMIQKATAVGNWWLAASSPQHARSCITSPAEFFVKHQITQVTQPLYSSGLAPCDFWLFPQTKITFEREEISDHWWNSGRYNRTEDCKTSCLKTVTIWKDGLPVNQELLQPWPVAQLLGASFQRAKVSGCGLNL